MNSALLYVKSSFRIWSLQVLTQTILLDLDNKTVAKDMGSLHW